jgi:phosphoglycerate dehydrogenase-like enzyme
LDNCTVTPHIAGNAVEAKKRAAGVIAEKVIIAMRDIPAFNLYKIKEVDKEIRCSKL